MSLEQEQEQQFCCWHWKQLIENKTIQTKEHEFENGKRFKSDSEFYKIHPKFIMWVENNYDLEKSGYHWYHFCPNCGNQKDSDENIKTWSKYWNILEY